jgi:hypothetical protein
MSYLSLPRVHFMGRSATTPPTTNNNNYNRILDPQNVAFFPPYDAPNMTDDEFRTFMMDLAWKDFAPFPLPNAQVLNGNWNYFGDNSYNVQNASIYAVENENGGKTSVITDAGQDGLIGASVQLLGNEYGDSPTPPVMVDCDPTSNFSTQLFSGKFVFGNAGCSCTAAATDTVPLPRAFTRWLDLSRNLAATPDARFGTIWVQPLPLATLQFDTSGNQSPTLALLQQLAQQGAGLIVRLINYYFERLYTDPELYALYQQGNYAMNQSAGILLGTIGALQTGEPATYAPGRMLLPNTTPLSYTFPGQQPVPFFLAPASAEVDTDRQVITLDLGTTFPEVYPPLPPPTPPPPPIPPPAPSDFTKIDLGTATLQVQNADGSTTDIGTFAYDNATYLATAGVVEVSYTQEQEADILAGSLQVVCSTAAANPVLTEKVNVADADDHCLYITEGESQVLQFRVAVRGMPPSDPVPVSLDQYRIVETDAPPPKPPATGIPLKWAYLVGANNPQVPAYLQVTPDSLTVDSSGLASVTITGLTPGLGFLRFLAGPASDNPVPVIGSSMGQWMTQIAWAFFVNVRVLPADADLANTPQENITWDFIYTNVLQYYYRLYPGMNHYIELNDPSVVGNINNRMIIKARTSKEIWNSTLYMPHTRELSDGKRTLLHRWCDLPPNG